MNFEIEIDDKTIYEAARLVVNHSVDRKFLEKVSAIKNFNHTNDNGIDVALKLRVFNPTIIIRPYTTANPWSKVIGYAQGNVIFVNTRKLDLPLNNRVENFMHEALHVMGYSHSGNSVTTYNLGTVPYKIAALFREYIEELKGEGKKETKLVCYCNPWTLFLTKRCYEKEVL